MLLSKGEKGALTDLSLLDLPGLGSSIANFDKHAKVNNWPTELNFAIYNGINGINHGINGVNSSDPQAINATDLLLEYKRLLSSWKTYMDARLAAARLGGQDGNDLFTEEMRNNRYFNFTNYIVAGEFEHWPCQYLYQKDNLIRIMGYHFSSQLTATLHLCLIYFKIT